MGSVRRRGEGVGWEGGCSLITGLLESQYQPCKSVSGKLCSRRQQPRPGGQWSDGNKCTTANQARVSAWTSPYLRKQQQNGPAVYVRLSGCRLGMFRVMTSVGAAPTSDRTFDCWCGCCSSGPIPRKRSNALNNQKRGSYSTNHIINSPVLADVASLLPVTHCALPMPIRNWIKFLRRMHTSRNFPDKCTADKSVGGDGVGAVQSPNHFSAPPSPGERHIPNSITFQSIHRAFEHFPKPCFIWFRRGCSLEVVWLRVRVIRPDRVALTPPPRVPWTLPSSGRPHHNS